jgi:hypothetical protein
VPVRCLSYREATKLLWSDRLRGGRFYFIQHVTRYFAKNEEQLSRTSRFYASAAIPNITRAKNPAIAAQS